MEGMKQGKEQGIIETAKNLKKIGINIEDIMKVTNLSKNELEKL